MSRSQFRTPVEFARQTSCYESRCELSSPPLSHPITPDGRLSIPTFQRVRHRKDAVMRLRLNWLQVGLLLVAPGCHQLRSGSTALLELSDRSRARALLGGNRQT